MMQSIAIKFVMFLFVASILGAPGQIMAASAYPDYIQANYTVPLTKIGQGTYRRWGVRVYVATLWAAGASWDPQKPFLLEIHYVRDLSKDTLVGGVIDDIKEQGVAGSETLAKWQQTLDATIPEVHDGDVLAGLAVPGKPSVLFFNGTKLTAIDDAALSKAFFNIWFGKQADEDLRGSLLGQKN